MTSKIAGWASSIIWYSVYPLGACGAPIRQGDVPGAHHRLSRLLNWLDHVVALGANGLALGPIWASSTHGYDIINHDAIDARLGDDHDFDELVTACRARGLRVLLDGVFNHVSSHHALVQQAQRYGVDSPAGRMLRHDPNRGDGLARFEGHDGLVEYDHSNPAVADAVASTMTRWLRRGADGWRLDAAYRVPAGFWTDVVGRVRREFPQSLTVAEVLHGDYAAIAAADNVDSTTQYELWKAIWSGLKDRNPHELMWALQRHAAAMTQRPGEFLPWTFVGNHDVTRIATLVGGHDALAATAILATLPGMPAIYYGDEYGFIGLKEQRIGGDDAIRPALPASPAMAGDSEVLRHHQLLFGLRRRHPWLQWADLSIVDNGHRFLTYRLTPSATQPGALPNDRITVRLDAADDNVHLVISDATGQLYALL